MELGLSLRLGRRDLEEEEDEELEELAVEDLQLSLLPSSHLSLIPCSNENKKYSSTEAEDGTARAVSGSPNSPASSFNLEFSAAAAGGGTTAAAGYGDGERASPRASDDDENGSSRKKLRLSREQSAFLEESFKEHHTLNPKQKVALAKQLNLRPRQVEVWFQNRRARTKLKQTEVDCEYLKRCCETLTEENRRLKKELSDIRALKTPSHPFFMHVPATTLSMCPSCEKTVATAAATNSNPNPNHDQSRSFYPFAPQPATSPAS